MGKRSTAERPSKAPPAPADGLVRGRAAAGLVRGRAAAGLPASGTHKTLKNRVGKDARRAAATAAAHGRAFDVLAVRLGSRMRQLRATKGWTQRATADRIGIGTAVVRRLEKGSANPSLAILVSVARAFGIPLKHLLGR
jgi:DNA-binding XRE family transcriptional regulator